MNRIVLQNQNWMLGTYLHDGAPYTGAAFECRAADDIIPHWLVDGKIVGPYVSLCEEGHHVTSRTELDAADCEYNSEYFNVGKFTGMGYLFGSGACYREVFFEDGEILTDTYWAGSGEWLSRFTKSYGDFGVTCDWSANNMESYLIVFNSNGEFFIRYSEDGRVECLGLDYKALQRIEEVAHQAKFIPVRSGAELFQLRAASTLRLLGTKVIEDFLLDHRAASVLVDVERLDLLPKYLGGLDPAFVELMPKLMYLDLDFNETSSRLGREVKRLRPDLVVTMGHETIRLC